MSAIFSSCSKYENGPGISLRSKTTRVVNHWKVEKAMWDGEDITDLLDGISYEFKNDNSYTFYEDGTSYENGQWALIESKESLEIIDNEYPEDKFSYKILRLKEKEMIWEYTEDDEVFEFTLVPK